MSEQQYRTIPPEEWDQNTVQVGDRFGRGEIDRVDGAYCLDKRDYSPPHWWITTIFLGVAKSQGLTWQRPVGEPAEPTWICEECGKVSPIDYAYKPCDCAKPTDPSKPEPAEKINHPAHYGGDTPYECIKVLEAWLTPEQASGFRIGNAMKYLSRSGKKGNRLEDLKKALWYLQREIEHAQNCS